MKRSENIIKITLVVATLVVGVALSTAARKPITPPSEDGPLKLPAPSTFDQVTHDVGNIATTIDNWGYIGGYDYYGYPSGEYPRNSGHNYIAEIRYWMGATSGNDTLVANTYDDFQSLPSLVSGTPENSIFLSTDTTRYYNYDPTDTTGQGYGSPAYGWKVWDLATESWVYTQNYSPIIDDFFEGGPVSVQESHYRFDDAAIGSSLMGLEMTQTVLQWNYCYNEDFIFVVLEIKNTNTSIDYNNFAFGLYVDMDIGGYDGTGENGRLGDLVGSDSTENLAWTYDSYGWDAGWNAATGYMGTKYIETPDGIGMTAFRTGEWELLPETDPGRFEVINSTDYDEALYPYDQYYVQCTRGIDLTAGKTVRVVYAIVAGDDEDDFRANATLAQELYDNHFVGPEPPATPVLSGNPRDEKVYLQWTDTSQVSVDPFSGERDFSGYKLYRSEDEGRTWGEPNYVTGNECQTFDYEPLETWAVDDARYPISRTYIDTGLTNGVEYWYCLVAFDKGDETTGIDVLQNGFGTPASASNVISITPRSDPAGVFEAAGVVTHLYNGTGEPSEGNAIAGVFDRTKLQTGEYHVVFEDRPEDTYWHLINTTTGDTALADQTLDNGDPEWFEVADGLKVVIRNADREPTFMGQTTLVGSDTNLVAYEFYGPAIPLMYGFTNDDVFGDAQYRSNYELRYTGESTFGPDIEEYIYGPGYSYDIPFEVWNTTTNQRVSLAVYDFEVNGTWEPYDLLIIVDYPYDAGNDLTTLAFPYYYGWMFEFDWDVYNPSIGDVFSIDGPLMNSPDDVFSFHVSGDDINDVEATQDLDNIKVVPNPYYAQSSARWEKDQGETVLEFQNLPDECTVRIYTLSGDLVKTLQNTSGSGTVRWNLLSEGQRLIASGIYFYHVESKYGDHLGRFAVVK